MTIRDAHFEPFDLAEASSTHLLPGSSGKLPRVAGSQRHSPRSCLAHSPQSGSRPTTSRLSPREHAPAPLPSQQFACLHAAIPPTAIRQARGMSTSTMSVFGSWSGLSWIRISKWPVSSRRTITHPPLESSTPATDCPSVGSVASKSLAFACLYGPSKSCSAIGVPTGVALSALPTLLLTGTRSCGNG